MFPKTEAIYVLRHESKRMFPSGIDTKKWDDILVGETTACQDSIKASTDWLPVLVNNDADVPYQIACPID